jgi:uncharacterized LabA/DUF88 family protein
METIFFIDGENFVKKIKAVLKQAKQPTRQLHLYNFKGLLDKVLKEVKISKSIFYFARIKEHPDTKEKSKQLIEAQRLLKTALERQGFEIVLSGSVRGQMEKGYRSKETLIFKEKGVDVKIAVDMVVSACGGGLKTAIIGSSDSDLQPAISELRKRKIEMIYLGFEMMPNKGLTYTTNRTILIRNSEVLEFSQKS